MASRRVRRGRSPESLGFLGRVREAYRILTGAGIPPGFTSLGRPEDAGFRRVTARSARELKPFEWRKQMDVSHYLWFTNPLAARIIELLNDHIIGDGFDFKAKDERVEKDLRDHWEDPDNAWDMKQFERSQEQSVFGVLAMRAFVNKEDGHVKLSTIDPGWITEVVPDQDRAGQADVLKIRKGRSMEEEALGVVQIDRDPESPTFDKLVGKAFYFPINKLSFTLHGVSDIFRQADWLDAYEQFIYSALERIEFLNAHLYDITIDNAGPDQIQQKIRDLEQNRPRPGGFRVHNQKETWSALAPKINSAEVEEMARLMKILILGSVGIPEHWVGEGGNTNVATAREMSGPILRKLRRRQAMWRDTLAMVLQFQIDQSIIAGSLPKDVDQSFEIITPVISEKDIATLADALIKIVDASTVAIEKNFISQEDGSKLVADAAANLGVEVKSQSKDEMDKQEVEQTAKSEEKARKIEEAAYADIGKNGKRAVDAS